MVTKLPAARIDSTTVLSTPNGPESVAAESSWAKTLSRKVLKLSVICPDKEIVDDILKILSDRNDVAILHAFAGNPGQAELDRHLQFHAPQAILVSTDGNYTFELIAYLRNAYPNLPIVLLHSVTKHGAASLLPFMRAGVQEVIFEPFDRQEVGEAVERVCALRDKDTVPKVGKVLCFLPSKPGVGASTVAINTAAALAQEGSKVLLVDGDLTSGMIRFMLKLKNPVSIREAAQRVSDLDEFLWPQMVSRVREGLDVLHSGRTSAACNLDSEALLSLMDFWRGAYDFVCFDFSGNLEPHCLGALRFAEQIFLVSTSEITSLHLLIEKAHLLKAHDLSERVEIVLNRKAQNDELSTRQVEATIRMPVRKVFRNNYAETVAANREGRTIRTNSALGSEFTVFAAELCGKPAQSSRTMSAIFAAFWKKKPATTTLQIAAAPVKSSRATIEFRPLLELPEASPTTIIRYKDSRAV